MHTEKTGKVLEWNNFGRKRIYYTATVCGQYYIYKMEGEYYAGRKMFGKDIDFRVAFPSLDNAKIFLQEHEDNKVIYVGDPV
jgi:hypothetical protein